MDISTPLISIVLFLAASLVLFLVYKFGIKEKSYEEALAEQREQTNALLGIKPKPKEKKKKVAKKSAQNKDKTHPENETDESEIIETNAREKEQDNTQPAKLHVEFKEDPEEVVQIKQKRVKKMKPILVKKDKSPVKVSVDVIETPIINHFEENHPKDDFELLRSNSKDDIFSQEPPKIKEKKQTKQNPESEKTKNQKKSVKSALKETQVEVPKPAVPAEKTVEVKIVEKVHTPTAPLANGVVAGNPGKEKKKKKSEFNTRQQLTAERDGLLNSVRKAELSKTEVQLLIDLLLNKQLEAPAVISDWTEGKSDPIQKLKKQLAEKEKALAEEQEALVGVQSKMKEIRAEQQAEKAQMQLKIRAIEEELEAKRMEVQAGNGRLQVTNQKTQKLQAELQAEMLKNRKIMEENAALQMQGQQFEVRMGQYSETENLIAKLRNDIEEYSSQNQQLRLELQKQQPFYIQLEETNQELTRNLEMAIISEDERKMQIANLQQHFEEKFQQRLEENLQQQFEENQRLKVAIEQLKEELRQAGSANMDSSKIIAQFKSEIQQLKEQHISQISGSSQESKAHEVKVLNLANELSSVRNELSQAKHELQHRESKFKTELEAKEINIRNVQEVLEEQKSKNNKLSLEIRTLEQESQKKFIQRLFPEVKELQTASSDDWRTEFEELIKNYVDSLKRQQKSQSPPPVDSKEVSKLQAEIHRYKAIIDETDGTLHNLQAYIESEEIKWRDQMTVKQSEIQHLEQSLVPQLNKKLHNAEVELRRESDERQRLSQLLKSSEGKSKSDETTTIERLSEEVDRLREQLRDERTKNKDINISLKDQNCSNPANGSAFIEVLPARNANICSNMGCQYLYCDGNSCRRN